MMQLKLKEQLVIYKVFQSFTDKPFPLIDLMHCATIFLLLSLPFRGKKGGEKSEQKPVTSKIYCMKIMNEMILLFIGENDLIL